MAHWSSCAVHNAPALPVGPCNCGGDAPEMSADILCVDFKTKSKKYTRNPEPEQQAVGISLDTPPEILAAIYESSLGFIAPTDDKA